MLRGWAGTAPAVSPSRPSTAFRSNCRATRRPSTFILRRRTKACSRRKAAAQNDRTNVRHSQARRKWQSRFAHQGHGGVESPRRQLFQGPGQQIFRKDLNAPGACVARSFNRLDKAPDVEFPFAAEPSIRDEFPVSARWRFEGAIIEL